jgi:hypothetical protein
VRKVLIAIIAAFSAAAILPVVVSNDALAAAKKKTKTEKPMKKTPVAGPEPRPSSSLWQAAGRCRCGQ